MTDDIVARLRCAEDMNDAVYHPWVYKDAADEIERLRKACYNCDPLAEKKVVGLMVDVERLRAENRRLDRAATAIAECYNEALVEVSTLRAEIERLRGTLRGVTDAWDWWQVDTYDRCASVMSDAIRGARAALTGEKRND